MKGLFPLHRLTRALPSCGSSCPARDCDMSAPPFAVAGGSFALLARTPNSWQNRLATSVVALFVLLFALTYLPAAQVRLPHFEVFVPAYAVVTLFDDWLTAYLLFIQFS